MGWSYHNKPPQGWPLDYDSGLVPDVGHWLMNEGSGNMIQDLSGNRNTGTLSGSVTWSRGIRGPVTNYPAGAAAIDIGTPAVRPTLDVDTISIVAWVNPGNLATWGHIYGAQYDQGAWLALDSAEKLAFYTKGVGVAYDSWTGIGSALTQGQCYCVAATYDGQYKYVYINGVLDGSKDTAAKAGLLDVDTSELIAIGNNITGSYDFVGDISNVMVWNRALTSSEIIKLYLTPFCMFKDPDEIPIFDQYYIAVAGMSGAMTTNSGYWGW